MRAKLWVGIGVATLCVCAVFGQLSEVASEQDFSAESFKTEFDEIRVGADVSSLYGALGIQFPSGPWGTATVRQVFVLTFIEQVVRNDRLTGDSSNQPFIIAFDHPVSKVGFTLSNGDAATQVTVTAFGPQGGQLGVVQKTGADSQFMAVGTSSATGIAKLVISYGDATSEQINNLIVEYLERPQFTAYLPQVGDGPIPGNGTFQTTIVVSNLSNSTAVGELDFFAGDGSALLLPIDETMTSNVPFSIPPFSSITLTTDGTSSPVGVGYARIVSNAPVEGTAVFRVLAVDESIETEAGVGSAAGKVLSVGAVQKVVAGNFDSGVAVVNVSETASDGEILAVNQNGDVVATNQAILDLEPGEHVARFLGQIFPSLAQQDFTGTIVIRSDVSLAAVVLRTGKGKVLSSLPVGSTQR